MKSIIAVAATGIILVLNSPDRASAQSGHDHSAHTGMDHGGAAAMPLETGQSAFAAIAEIVNILRADPDTDWNKVDIGALQAHLADMDTVTLHAQVATAPVDGGAVFDVTSDNPAVSGAIRRMTLAHGATMSGTDGMDMSAEKIPGGARMTVTGADETMIRALGFFGVMTLGMHHQAHHLALAQGIDPHGH